MLSCSSIARYLIKSGNQGCGLWVLSVAEARGHVCVAFKVCWFSKCSRDSKLSPAGLSVSLSLPPDDISGHARLIVSLTREAMAWLGGHCWVCARVCVCVCVRHPFTPSGLCRSSPPTHCWTSCSNPQAFLNKTRTVTLKVREANHVLPVSFFPFRWSVFLDYDVHM